MGWQLVVPLPALGTPGDDLGQLVGDADPLDLVDAERDHDANVLRALGHGPEQRLEGSREGGVRYAQSTHTINEVHNEVSP